MNTNQPLVLPFADIRARDLPLVGGKGANLGEMVAAGIPVPPGFCLTTVAFRQFMAACPESEDLYLLLEDLTPDDLDAARRVGQHVRQTLLQVLVPDEVGAAVRQAWQQVGEKHAYAVRSSATAEDLPEASFAGQQDTYLNVRGEAALLDAVHCCWVSLFTDRAILYRLQNGFSHRLVGLAVVVQQMVMARQSGILFTADPLTGHRHTLAIDAGFGLGEALVGGLITPDTYRVDKRTRTIIARQIAEKEIAIYPQPEGGTRQVTLPAELRSAAVLSDEQILALADLACRIEAHYGQPQDIEWAIAPEMGASRENAQLPGFRQAQPAAAEGDTANAIASEAQPSEALSALANREPNTPPGFETRPPLEVWSPRTVPSEVKQPPSQQAGDHSIGLRPARDDIYIVQTRPITSLYPIDGLQSPDDSLHIFFSVGHQQGMTRPMKPLSLSSFPLLIPFGHTPDGFGFPYLRTSGGRLFVDLTQFLRNPVIKRFIFALTSQFDVLAPQILKAVMQRPEFRRAKPVRFNAAFLRFMPRLMRRLFIALWRRDLSGFAARINAMQDDFIADMRRRLRAAPPGRERLQTVREILPTLFSFFLHWVPEAAAGIAATRLLPRLAWRHLSPAESEALTLGIPYNVVNEMNMAIGDLADLARRSPALVSHFDRLGDDAHTWLAAAAALNGAQLFLDAWRAFLARYGVRGPSEIDIATPRWLEDPLPLLQVIASHLQGKAGRHRAQWQASIREREAAFQHLLTAAARGPWGGLRTRLFRRLYHVMTEAGGMREHHKFLAVRLLWEAKQVLYPVRSVTGNQPDEPTIAEILVAQGKLRHPADIWYLTWRELFAIWDDDATDWGALIARRRAEMERFARLSPPIIITSDGETPVVRYEVETAPPGALVGNPVSAGMVEGVAHVIRDLQRETLAPGEILVTEFTDPGWTPLFINAGGLIMEIGGALTHGAVVAREYGIPAVVGVRGATRQIQTGQRVRVDGNRGVVEILYRGIETPH